MKRIDSIMVAVDFAGNAEKLAAGAVSLARQLGGGIILVHVVESLEKYSGFALPHMSIARMQEDLEAAAQRKMQAFAAQAIPEDLLRATMVLCGDPAEQIVAAATDKAVDLLVLATHGAVGLERALFGSVAERVVKTAPCPVMTFRPFFSS